MTLCYVVPGMLGTELWLAPPDDGVRVWIDYPRIADGHLTYLELSPNGITTPPGFTATVLPRGLVQQYYGDCVTQLGQQLGPKGYRIRPWGYDWRREIASLGTQLALTIGAEVQPSDPPCTIVAHSMGGLVARVAWRTLGRMGLQSLVRRIITLGTPHQGSYVAFRALAGQDQATLALSLLSFAGFAFSQALRNPFKAFYTVTQLCAIMATWPGLYELLPMLGGTDAEDDPLRDCVYADRICPVSLAATYSSTPPIGSPWLAYARDVWWPQMRDDPTTLPPPDVLTTVGGSTYLTGGTAIAQWDGTEQMSTFLTVDNDRSGDGTVTWVSALIPSARRYTVDCLHVPMPNALAISGQLAAWVLEDTPVPPTPGIVAGLRSGTPASIPPRTSAAVAGTDC